MDTPGQFKSEFVINNLAADQREFLLKKDIRTEISRCAGVHISIRGRYVKPKSDGSLLCESNTRPLHLLIVGRTKHNLTLAMKKIQDVLRLSTGNEKRDDEVPETAIALEEKITVGIDIWPSVFGMKAKILGENYENINYIKKETNAVIALRGKGIGLAIDDETDEPLHVLVQYGDPKTKDKARQLILNLIETVQKEFLERYAKYYTPPKKPDIIPVEHVRRPKKRSSTPDDKSHSNNKRAKIVPSPKPLRSPTPPPQTEESRNFSSKKDIDKITIGIDSVPLDFNLKSKIYGQALMNVKHIEKTTGALLLLQGRGCGSGGGDKLESDVAPYLIVKYKKPELKEAARNLIFNLIETVQQEYSAQYGAYLTKPKKPQIVPFDASLIEKKPTQSTALSTKPNFSNSSSELSNESSKQLPYTKQPTVSSMSSRSSQLAATTKRPSYAGRSSEVNSSSRTSLPMTTNPVIVPPPPPVISKPLPPIIPKPIPYTFDETPNAVPALSSSSSSRQSVPESITSRLTSINAQSSTYVNTAVTFPTQKSHLPTQPVPSHPASQNRNLQYLKKKSPPPERPVKSSYPECKNVCNPSNTDPSGNLPVQREQNIPKQKSVKTTRCLVPLTPYTQPIRSTTSTVTVTTTSLNGAKPATSSRFHWEPPPNLKSSIDTRESESKSDSPFFKHYDSTISDSDDNKSLICIDSEDEFGDYDDLARTLSKIPRVRSIAVQTDDNVLLKKKQLQCTCGKFTHFLTGVRSFGVQTEVYRF